MRKTVERLSASVTLQLLRVGSRRYASRARQTGAEVLANTVYESRIHSVHLIAVIINSN